jgi:hypothetical protein
MSWFETAKDWVGLGTGILAPEVKEAIGFGETVGDAGATAYDYVTGDTDHANEHAKDLAWDLGGDAPVVGPGVDGVKTVKDTTESIDETITPKPDKPDNDYGGTGAKIGAILGAGFGLPCLIAGTAIGGLIGTFSTPEAQGQPISQSGDNKAPTDFNNVIIAAKDTMAASQAGTLPAADDESPAPVVAPVPSVEGPPAPTSAPPPSLIPSPNPGPTPLDKPAPYNPFAYYGD